MALSGTLARSDPASPSGFPAAAGAPGGAPRGGPGRSRRLLGIAAFLTSAAVILLGVRDVDAPQPRPSAAPVEAPVVRASGVFCTGARDSCAGSFAAWRGASVALLGSYLPGDDWPGIEVPGWWQDKWRGSPYVDRMLVSLPMLPSDRSQTLVRGAAGDYDGHFRTAARHLVALGMGTAWIRPGWEFNGSWSRIDARSHPEQFRAYFQHVVTAMRSVPGARFRFDWNVATGSHGWDTTLAYPGDDYVDAVGQDVYDMEYGRSDSTSQSRWANLLTPSSGTYRYGLDFWADFARQHGKPLSYAEWGLVGAGSRMAKGGHGGDDPAFIHRMARWFDDHPTVFETYFDTDAPDGSHELRGGRFPTAAAAYQDLFAGGRPVAAPPEPAGPGEASVSDRPTAAASSTPEPSPAHPATGVAGGAAPGAALAAALVLVSGATDRSAARPLEEARVSGPVYVFLDLPSAREVHFYLDDGWMQGQPFHREVSTPFDLVGTSGGGAQALDTDRLAPGSHVLTVQAETATGSSVVRVPFTVGQ